MNDRDSTAAVPRARRLTRPRWRDPRLLIGAVLVLLSLLATTGLVRAVAQTTRVWAAAEALVPGSVITPDSLIAVEVKLPVSGPAYIEADSVLAEGTTVRAVVGEGELLARSVLVAQADLPGRVVSVDVSSALPAAVARGSGVDIWATDARSAEAAPPSAILTEVDVLSVDRGTRDFTAPGGARIEVYVPDGRIAEVVRAQALGHHISVVEVPRSGTAPHPDTGGDSGAGGAADSDSAAGTGEATGAGSS